MPRPIKHKPGDQVGQWTLLEYVPGRQRPRIMALWHCRCSCGEERDVQTSNLRSGASTSCGHDQAAQRAAIARQRPRAASGTFTPVQQA